MIERSLGSEIFESLQFMPAVAVLGPRQVGKTTLALDIVRYVEKETVYLDLEKHADRVKLDEPDLYLREQAGKLVILDEIQRVPELFPLLRGLIDERRRQGENASQFLITGSASRLLLRQSSESLAGRIAYHELWPLTYRELRSQDDEFDANRLWLRGGFPLSTLAKNDRQSSQWRNNFIWHQSPCGTI